MSELKKVIEKLTDKEISQKYEKLMEYKERILDINKMVNITRITDPEEFDAKHYIDSLASCLSPEFKAASTVIDVGSGGGFPGIPLAVLYPEKDFLLMDSSGKRMKIVGEISDDLGINNVRVLHGRAEELGRSSEYRERFDVCVSRAVASLSTLCEYCLPFVKPGGCFISYKGPESDEEIAAADTAISVLGGRLDRIENNSGTMFAGSGNEGHRLIYIMKEKSTPDKYPRGGGKPSKKPL